MSPSRHAPAHFGCYLPQTVRVTLKLSRQNGRSRKKIQKQHNSFGTFGLQMPPGALGASCGSLGALGVPCGCLLGASWVPPGCFLAGSWLPGALGLTLRLIDQGSLGCHSGQGSLIPVVTQEFSSRKKMGGCKARLFVQNFDAVLMVVVIFAGDAIFACFYRKCRKH